MQLNDFHFKLPQELIARYPLEERSASKLLCLTGENSLVHRQFNELIHLLHEGDLLIFNDTKVIPARLFGQKITGGQVEVLVERVLDQQHILAQVRSSKSPKLGDDLIFLDDIRFEVKSRQQQFYELYYPKQDRSILDVIEAIGQIPLPPYMNRTPDEHDKERYQTVYAKHKGSIAAPTAGLHFDEALLRLLHEKKVTMDYLTLHIGAGTFSPIRVGNIHEHTMHTEYLEVTATLCEKIHLTKQRGKRVVAVGTTSLRALETASQSGITQPYQGETNIFIYPGYEFKCADVLITNLHLPCSTLLMLVCAFGGYNAVMHAYQEAVAQSYRFYSYGDAMLVTKNIHTKAHPW